MVGAHQIIGVYGTILKPLRCAGAGVIQKVLVRITCPSSGPLPVGDGTSEQVLFAQLPGGGDANNNTMEERLKHKVKYGSI